MKRKLYMVFFVAAWLGIAACVQEPGNDGGSSGQAVSTDEAARVERLQEAAQMRAKFDESELKEYATNYLRELIGEVYPEANLDDLEITIYKESPTQQEVEALGGDEEKAFSLMRDADFLISVFKTDGTAYIPYEQRKDFLNALGDRGFTAHLELGFYEYDYIVAGEVHVEPKPGY